MSPRYSITTAVGKPFGLTVATTASFLHPPFKIGADKDFTRGEVEETVGTSFVLFALTANTVETTVISERNTFFMFFYLLIDLSIYNFLPLIIHILAILSSIEKTSLSRGFFIL